VQMFENESVVFSRPDATDLPELHDFAQQVSSRY